MINLRPLTTGAAREMFCPICGSNVRFLTPLEKDGFMANWVEVAKLTKNGSVHAIYGAVGSVRICLNSILRRVYRTGTKGKIFKLRPCTV